MPIIERDVVLQGVDKDGNPTIDMPITRLGNIEDTAKIKETLVDKDYIPVIDSEDGEMTKVEVAVFKQYGAAADKQDTLTGQPGQIVGFSGEGQATALTLTPGPNVTLKQDGSSMEIGAVVPGMNLLDDGYFLYPVNQRNIASGELWGGYAYGIDRWRSFGADVTKWVYGEGIYLTNGQNSIIEQHMEASVLPDGAVLMLSALANNQIIDMTFVVSSKNVNKVIILDGETMELQFLVNYPADKIYTARIWHRYRDGGNAVKVTAAKLELGTVQTIAHKEGDTLVLNDPPPNKALELAKCQRYQVVFDNLTAQDGNAYGYIGNFVCYEPDKIRVQLTLPQPLRARPSFSLSSSTGLRIVNGAQRTVFWVPNPIFASAGICQNELALDILNCPTGTVNPGDTGWVDLGDDPAAKLIIDANL